MDDDLAALREAIDRDPEDAKNYAALGRALLRQEDLDDAVAAFREAISRDLDNAAYLNDLGRLLFRQGRLGGAQVFLRGAVRLDPDNATYLADFGRLLLAENRVLPAQGTFRKAVRLDPGNAAYLADLARVLQRREQFHEAESLLRQAVSRDKQNTAYLADLARVLRRRHQFRKAESLLRQAVSRDKQNTAYLVDLGLVLLEQKRNAEAEAVLRKVTNLDPRATRTYAADLEVRLSEAYNTAIPDYILKLADQASNRTEIERQGIRWDDYIENVKQLVDTQLPNLRTPYRDWSATRREEDSNRNDLTRSVRRNIILTISITLIPLATASTVILWGRVLPSYVGRIPYYLGIGLLGLTSLVFVIRYGRKAWRSVVQRRAIGKDSYILEDQLTTLISKLILDPAITASLRTVWRDSSSDLVRILDGIELSAKAEVNNLVSTAANNRLAIALSRRYGAAVGVAGPRGSGKTELARAFTGLRSSEVSTRTIPLMLWAPVRYGARTFLLRILKDLCIAVISVGSGLSSDSYPVLREQRQRRYLAVRSIFVVLTGLGIALIVIDLMGISFKAIVPLMAGSIFIAAGIVFLVYERLSHFGTVAGSAANPALRRSTLQFAADLRARVEFTETYTVGSEFGISGRGISVSATEGTQLARMPLNEVDVVRELRNLVELVAEDGWQVVIAIDELDKMSSSKNAEEFLNHLKVLFPIHNCSFIVSVSEDAWALFENRGLPFRDTFDSSFDEIVHVEMLRPRESRDLLKRRSSGITDTQSLLCHCLSGGLPRDLLRTTRRLAQISSQLQTGGDMAPPPLRFVLDLLLAEEVHDKLAAAEIRISKRTSSKRRASIMQMIACWSDIWPDYSATEQELRHYRQDYMDSISRQVGEPELVQYIAVLHTIRQAFAPGGPLIQLENEVDFASPLISNGFDLLAKARRRVATNVSDAWKLLDSARNTLALGPLADADPDSGGTPDEPKRPSNRPARTPTLARSAAKPRARPRSQSSDGLPPPAIRRDTTTP